MNGFWAVFKRELKGYFATPVAYVFLVIFLFFAGYLPFRDGFFEIRQAELRLFFANLPLLFIFMVPSTAMRLWAEERRSGSIEFLMTLPITVPQAVLGKFFAAWAFLGIALLLTFPMPGILYYLGRPDPGLFITSYMGSFFLAGAFLAISSFFSAITKNQIVAFILSVTSICILVFSDNPTTLEFISISKFLFDGVRWQGKVGVVLIWVFLFIVSLWLVLKTIEKRGILFYVLSFFCANFLLDLITAVVMIILSVIPTPALLNVLSKISIQASYDSFLRGVVEIKDLSYFVILIVAWISACTIVLGERKAA